MTHHYSLLELMAIGFCLALFFGYLAQRLRLSPIVGYLLAGFLAGPYSPGFVADPELAHQLSEAGVILLMFGVGLHFDVQDLLAVRGVALPGAVAQSLAATLLGATAAHFLGFGLGPGLVLGLGLSVASTVVLIRVLTDNGAVGSVHGHVAVGWLVVEDIFTVLVLVLMPSVAAILHGSGANDLASVAGTVGMALLRIVALFLLVIVVGGRVVPWVLTKIVRTRSQELFTLAVLVAAFATAVGAAVFFQASMALGAFLGGMVVGRTRVSHQAAADVLPLRDAFAVLFFLSVGMLFNPGFLMENPVMILACLAIVLVAKPLTAIVVVFALGYSSTTALTVAVGLSQIGEFSFILAQAARGVELLPNDDVYNVLVVCAIASITVNPGLFRKTPAIDRFLNENSRLWRLLNARAESKACDRRAETPIPPELEAKDGEGETLAVVVGYGPTGQSVTKALLDSGVTPVVVDLNVDTVNSLNQAEPCQLAVFGDSTKRDVLLGARTDKARYLVITLPSVENAVVTAAMAKTLNPDIRILARARFMQDAALFERVGVGGVATEEEEVAKALAALLERDLQSRKPEGEEGRLDFDALEKLDLEETK